MPAVKKVTINFEDPDILPTCICDRENLPIYFQDELYYVNDARHHRYKVVKVQIGLNGEVEVFIVNIDGSFIPGWVSPSELTHIKPTTNIEKIMEECEIYLADCDIEWVQKHIKQAYELGKQEA